MSYILRKNEMYVGINKKKNLDASSSEKPIKKTYIEKNEVMSVF